MARRSKTIVGLDIEPGSIAAVQVATADGLAVERAAVADLDPHVVRDGEVADGEALTEALRAMWSQNSWLDRKVRIGVANARIVVRVMDLPPLEDAKDLEAAVQFQAKDELPDGDRPGGHRLPVARPRRDARGHAPPRRARRGPPRHDRAPAERGPRRRPAPRGRRPLRLRHGPRPRRRGRPGALRLRRRAHEPRGRRERQLPLHPRLGRRPRGHGDRPGRAPGPDPGPRPRLAAPRRPRAPRSTRSTASRRSSPTPAPC